MKKVWVLEKWVDRDEYIRIMTGGLELVDKMEEKYGVSEDTSKIRDAYIEKLRKSDDSTFRGEWFGEVGRTNYKQFCYDAVDEIALTRKKKMDLLYRVVSAQIEDDATEWLGYVNPIENAGVLKYLYVQVKLYHNY